MATNQKNQNDFGHFDFDTDLDFNLDSDINASPPGKERKPVDHVLDGVKSSMRNKLLDRSTYTRITRDALPEGLGKAWDAASTITTDSARLYDDAVREVRPHLSPIARKIDALVPDSAGRLKRFTRMLKDKTAGTVDNASGDPARSAEDAGVASLMSEVFDERDKRDAEHQEDRDRVADARKILDDRINTQRFSTNMRALNAIAQSTAAVRDYTTGFNMKFQKKSLELQYRTYLTQASMLKSFNDARKISEAHMAGILKNTGLPEYAKVTEVERFKQVAKNQLFGRVNDSIFGGGNRVDMAMQRIKKSTRSALDSFKENLSFANESLEGVIDARDMKRDMAEMEGRKHSGWNDFGELIGSVLGEKASGLASKHLKPLLEKNPQLMKASHTLGRFGANPGAVLDKINRSDKVSGLQDQGLMGQMGYQVIQALTSLFAGVKPDMSIKGIGIGEENEDRAYTDVRVRRAQVDVIPGYLARILREVQVLRTGDTKTPLLGWDASAGKFKEERQIASDLMGRMRKEVDKSFFGARSKEMYDSFTSGHKVEGGNQQEVQKFLNKLSRRTDFDYDGERMKDTKEFRDLSPEARKLVSKILDQKYSGSDMDAAKNKYDLTSSAMSLRDSTGDFRGEIMKAIRDGHADALQAQGIIKPRDGGGWDIDEDKYYEMMDQGTMATSDINAKRDIRSYNIKQNPIRALGGIVRTKLYNWRYNKDQGKGDADQFGPMAHDVRANQGENVAPGGKQIDLIAANGQNMAAIQALDAKVEKAVAGKAAVTQLSQINEKMGKLLEMFQGGAPRAGFGGSGGSGDTGTTMGSLSQLLGAGGSAIGNTAAAGYRVGKGVVNNVLSPMGKSISEAFQKNKGALQAGTTEFMNQTLGLMTKAMGFGTKVLFEHIPNGMDFLSRLGKSAKEGAMKLLNGARDVYIQGKNSPALQANLMRMGAYRDQLTGKVIETMDDLVKIKNNIVNEAGEVVLTVEEMAKGLFDNRGEKIRTAAMGAAYTAAGAVIGTGKALFGIASRGLSALSNTGPIKSLANMGVKARQEVADMVGQMTGGVGGKRSEEILIQIRDILALMKPGRRTSDILRRSDERPTEARNEAERMEDNPGAADRGILRQIRDVMSLQAPPEMVEKIMERANRTESFLKEQTAGMANRRWVAGLKDWWKKRSDPVQDGVQSSGDGQAGPAAATDSGGQTVMGPGGSGMGGIMKNLGRLGGQAAGLAAGGTGWLGDKLDKRRADKAAATIGPQLPGGKASRWGGLAGKVSGFASRGLGKVRGVLKGISGFLSNATGGADQNAPQQPGQEQEQAGGNTYTAASHAARLLDMGRDRLTRGYRTAKSKIFNDRNGDGSRDNGAGDRKEELENIRKANEERKAASIADSTSRLGGPKYYSGEGAIEKFLGGASSMLSKIAGGAGSVISTAGEMLLGAKSLLATKGIGGLLKGGASMIGRGVMGAVGVAGGLAKAGLGGLRTIGTALSAGSGMAAKFGSKIPGAARAGGSLMRAGSIGFRILQAGGLAMGGTGGTLLAGASTAISAIGAALTTPVIIGAAAVAGVAAGGYYTYKYFTRNKMDTWQKIRALQYGLDGTDATEQYNSKVKALEAYLLDGRIGYNRQTPYINDRSTEPKALLEIFDIDKGDEEQISKFGTWLEGRFKPFFLHHLAVLAKIDMKAKLSEVGDLKAPQLLEYANKIGFESGPYDETTSPFKGLDVLSTDKTPALNLIKEKINELGNKVQRNAKDGLASIKGVTALKPVESATKDAALKIRDDAIEKTNIARPAPNQYSVPENLRNAGRGTAGAGGGTAEDGIKNDAPSATNDDSASITGTGKVALAGGAVKDGSAGMQFIKLGKDAKLEGVHPGIVKNLTGMAQEYGESTGKSITVTEGHRSFQRQQELYRQNPAKAARPGSSMHEFGLALDISSADMDVLDKMGLLRKYGFTRPVGGERWHAEPAGLQANIARAKQDPAFASLAIQQSVGRGGGGIGAIAGSPLGRRDAKFAMALYNMDQAPNVQVKPGDSRDDALVEAGLMDKKSSTRVIDEKIEKLPESSRTSPREAANDNVQFSGNYGKTPQAPAPTQTAAIQGEGEPKPAAQGETPAQAKPSMDALGNMTLPAKAANDAPANDADGGKYGDVKEQIRKASLEAGVDPNKMMMLAAIESGMNPNARARGTSATGLHQFLAGTWKEQLAKHGSRYGLSADASPTDIRASTLMGAEYMKANEKAIGKFRPNPSFTDAYIAHFLGAGGARSFFRANPNEIAAEALPEAAAKNPGIFYTNGKPLTISEVYAKIEGRIATKAKGYGLSLSTKALSAAAPAANDASSTGIITPEDAKAKGGGSTTVANTDISAAPSTTPSTASATPGDYGSSSNVATPGARGPNDGGTPKASTFSMGAAMGGAQTRDISKSQASAVDVTWTKVADNSDRQVQHLSSIDETAKAQLTVLKEISGKLDQQSGGQASPQGQSGGARPSGGSQRRDATASSFDNRRRLTA